MGILSDADINEADALSNGEPGQLEFLKGFENGWKEVKNRKFERGTGEEIRDLAHFMSRSVDDFGDRLRLPETYFLKYPADFGLHLGHIVACLRYHPKLILSVPPQLVSKLLEHLGKKYPKYHAYLITKFQKWKEDIKTHVATLQPPESQHYATLITLF